jgi:hypothetical protein
VSGILTPSQINAKPAYSPPASSVAWKTRKPSAVVFTALGFFIVLGVTVAFDPSFAGRALAAATILALALFLAYRTEIETWQLITLSSLTGYVVLNYGFENLNLPVGPFRFLPVGELLMGVALLLALRRHSAAEFREGLRDPSMVCIFSTLLLTMVPIYRNTVCTRCATPPLLLKRSSFSLAWCGPRANATSSYFPNGSWRSSS